MRAKVPEKNPNMVLYDGTSDPRHNLSKFQSRMYLAGALDATRCKAFPTTLTKAAQHWFDSASDMLRIDPKLASHKLVVYPGTRPVQQRRQKMNEEQAQVVEE
ncbi:hypothetical protein PIB30_093689 [Stylosanthes scabra]|uniref:Uncharacterized protein n=1 Tax=Stylosanthes scabra TaxID=79078 RepID=A0ABU6ZTU1_9FABA|nr:hypothetical protein [Stylosanthes scabra]